MINKVMYVLNDFVRNIRVNVENVLFTDKINNESKLKNLNFEFRTIKF